MQYAQVVDYRYECLRCHRTFRVYPQGVLADAFRTVTDEQGLFQQVCKSHDGAVRLWDVASGEVRDVLDARRGPVRHLAFNSEGRILASVHSDETVILWTMAVGP